MRLKRLDIISYGHFTDNSIEFPFNNNDFHIVYGFNEAGKSTALSAIEDFLFGITTHSPYNFLHDYNSMRVGAVLENEKSSLEVIRRKGTKDTLLGKDKLPIPGGESAIDAFLVGADRSFFERMFSLDHKRLEEGGQEILKAKDEVGQTLFSAGSGIAGLRDRLTDLLEESDNIWTPRRASHRKYYQAYDKFKEAEKELREQTLTASKWHELKKALDTAENNYTTIEQMYEKISAEGKQLSRIRRVHRFVHKKEELEKDIEDLGKDVVLLPEDALEVLENSVRKQTEASTRKDTLDGQLKKALLDLKDLTYDEKLVLRVEDLDQLHERRIEIRREKADLPKRQAELDAAEKSLRDLATELGWQVGETSTLISRIPVRSKINLVRNLLLQHGELASDVSNKKESLDEVKAEHVELQKLFDLIANINDISRLEDITKTIREGDDINSKLRSAEEHSTTTKEQVESYLHRLELNTMGAKDATELKVPTRTEIERHRDYFQDLDKRIRETRQLIERDEEELNRTRQTFEKAVLDERNITTNDIAEVRERRDELWKLTKLKYIENLPIPEEKSLIFAAELDDLPTSFETAIYSVDNLLDKRFDNAKSAGQLAEMSRSISNQEDNLKILQKRFDALTIEGEGLTADWHAIWNNLPFQLRNPDAMLKWLETYAELMKSVEQHLEATSEVKNLSERVKQAKESLLTELAVVDTIPDGLSNDSLHMILNYAIRVIENNKLEAQKKSELKKKIADAATIIVRRTRELSRSKEDYSHWQKDWSEALTDLGLATNLAHSEISTQIDIIDQMRDQARQINDLQHQRINKIKKDIVDFESEVKQVVKEVANDLSDLAADTAVLEIEKRLQEAQQISKLQVKKVDEVEDIKKSITTIDVENQEALASLNHLKKLVDTESIEELKNAIEKSDKLRSLQLELSEIEQTLEQEGDGLGFKTLKQECASIDIDQIAAREDTNSKNLEEHRLQLTSAAEDRLQARGAFKVMGGDSTNAQTEATRQEALSELQALARRYVLVRTSATLLQWAIDRYRQEKQAPLLKRAGQLFSTITVGSFTGLSVEYDDKDVAHLTGLRSNGEVVRVSGLSSGTADQLYLALRIAFIEEYLDRSDPLPFIADDLFINFDNDRAKAGFQVLAELANKTQVLFFTHHQHLLDIAKKVFGQKYSIITLKP